MPISYEQAQPFQGQNYANYGAAQTRLAAAPQIAGLQAQIGAQRTAAAGDAARIQAGLVAGDAARLQEGMDNQARQRLANDQFAASGTPTDRDAFLAQAERSQVQDRFRLQAELQEVELTQQEKMRLNRMKAAIGEVQNDTSLTAEEKANLTMQLKTGIDPQERRIALQRAKSEQQVMDAKVKMIQSEQMLEENRLKLASGTADDKVVIMPDGQFARETADVFKDLHPEWTPKQIEAAVKEEALRTGQYTRLMPNAKGELQPLDESQLGNVGKHAPGTRGKGAGAVSTPGDVFAKHLAEVSKDETIPADKKIEEATKRSDAQLDYAAKKTAAATVAKPAKFDPMEPSSGTAPQRKMVEAVQATVFEIMKDPLVARELKTEASKLVNEYLTLMGKYSGPDGNFAGPPQVLEKALKIRAQINQIEAIVKQRAPATVATPVPPAAPGSVPNVGQTGGVNPATGRQYVVAGAPPGKDMGDAIADAVGWKGGPVVRPATPAVPGGPNMLDAAIDYLKDSWLNPGFDTRK